MSDLALSSLEIVDSNGDLVVVGSWDNNVYLYEVTTARVVETLSAHHDAVSCMKFYGSTLVTGMYVCFTILIVYKVVK